MIYEDPAALIGKYRKLPEIGAWRAQIRTLGVISHNESARDSREFVLNSVNA
jgi:hypothetical protein